MLRFIIIVFISITAVSIQAQDAIDPNPDLSLLWGQVARQPPDFSVACMPLASPADVVLYNANEPFPLASVSKLLIFIEYARRLEAGTIPRDELVEITTLNHYDLPRTDRGAHDRFLELYESDRIPLWDIAATGMIQYSSNAASDYMLARLAPVDWPALYALLGLRSSSYPHPLGMIPLLMNNHETGQPRLDEVPALSAAQGESLFAKYLDDPQWRQAEVEHWQRRRSFPDWEIQAAILQQHTATGTATDFLNVLYAVYSEPSPLSQNVKRLVRSALRWNGYAALDNTYVEYGSKLGFYSGGTLALVAYGDPFYGEPVISVALFRNIPRRTYRDFLDEDSIGYLAHWMNLNQCAGLVDAIQGV